MTKKYYALDIIDQKYVHVLELIKNLRAEDKREILGFGEKPSENIRKAFHRSVYGKSAIIDGKVAAMWGVHGNMLGLTGTPWLLTTYECEKVSPIIFAKIYHNEVMQMLKWFPVLVNYVDATYEKSIRLMELVGFTVGNPILIEKTGAMFRRFTMKSSEI